MATNVFTSFSASTLMSNNRASSSPLLHGLGPRSDLFRKPSLKVPSSKTSSLMVKAQQRGSPKRSDWPIPPEQYHKNVAVTETTYVGTTPWNRTEDKDEIKMWFDMPGLGAENIQVEVVDDLLLIKGVGNQIFSPNGYNNRVQLPSNFWKEGISVVYKNGVLYVTVPIINKFEHKVSHIPVRSA